MKKIKLVILIVILFFGVELYLKNKKPTPYLYDSELGWTLKKNFKHTYEEKDFYSNHYSSFYLTDNLGARPFIKKGSSDKSKQSTRILVVGDSFTMDPYVGNDEMWYSILANKIEENTGQDVKVLAFGGGAYGNLQQLMLLQRHKESIDNFSPNIFILQFCLNDFANNSFNIEKASFSISQYMRRPYLVNDKIYYYDGLLSYFFQKNILTRESRIFAKGVFIFENLKKKYFSSNSDKIDKYQIDEARNTTKNILFKIRSLYPNIESYVFSCSNNTSELNKDWQELAKKTNFIILEESSDFIDKAERSNKKIFYKDGGHLNVLGNSYWGELIYEEIMKKKLNLKY
jgi:lysophospholipase L1-like esterase